MRDVFRVLIAAWVALVLAAAGAHAQNERSPGARSLDDFADTAAWKAAATEGVKVQALSSPGPALRLDYDFATVSGWASVRRALPLDLPDNYELSFWLHGAGPANTLEVKLADAGGDNVWWRRFRDLDFPAERRKFTLKKRQIEFAWGPAADHVLRHAGSLEFVVSRGKGGGRGSIWIDHLAFRVLPPEPATPPPLTASSPAPGSSPASAVDGDPATAWRAPQGEQSITFDLGLVREFGGVTLSWAPGRHAADYDVNLSDDGKTWRSARRVEHAHGGRQDLRLPEAEARYVRLDLHGGPGADYALTDLVIQPPSYGETPNGFVATVAKAARPGAYPRGFAGQQTYWTLVGADGGPQTGLISEDGAIELAKGGASVEPFVIDDHGLQTWADVAIKQSLKDGDLPIPSVTWRRPGWDLKITTFAAGDAKAARLVGRYDLHNTAGRTSTLTLALAVRPFQVNGPYQTLNLTGGVSAIHDLAWDGLWININGKPTLAPLSAPDRFEASSFMGGDVPGALTSDHAAATAVHDADGLASGALIYRFTLSPGATATVGWTAPLSETASAPPRPPASPAWLADQEARVAAGWRARLDRVAFTVPPEGRDLVATLKTAVAHMRMSRDGAVLRPGTRSYDRAWIRDGAMISEAMLRMGDTDVAGDFLAWYAPRQFADGKIPCCVDDRGADPTAENDSEGELIYLAAEIYRYTGDKAALRRVWPHVLAAADYMDTLRASERTDANRTPERRMQYGLLAPSISHEGYSAKPAYSYWDDFWALRGYNDAVFIAGALGEDVAGARLGRSRDEFRRDLLASVQAAAVAHGLEFIPGAADLGDFDATSTTIALSPAGLEDALPKTLLVNTFERFWRNFLTRRDTDKTWEDYTPYEWRAVGTFVRLGQRERVGALIDFYMKDRRPLAWNGWAEVVGRDARKPRYIGDMPHAWIASDYVRSVLDMFAYERERDHALVLGAGLPAAWFLKGGVGISNLRTAFGPLTWSARVRGDKLILTIAGPARPPGGYDFPWPFADAPGVARMNGRPLAWKAGVMHIPGPGEVVIDR